MNTHRSLPAATGWGALIGVLRGLGVVFSAVLLPLLATLQVISAVELWRHE